MTRATIRSYRTEDRAAVRRICYQTGLVGNDVYDHYRDFESYADIFTSYYTDREPEHALVAELDGKVVGYLLGCVDTRRAWSPYRVAMKHVLLRGVCFRPGTAAYYWRGIWDSMTDLAKPGRPHFDLARFPSHTHVNFLPEARGSGSIVPFYNRMNDMLRQAGSCGAHVECSANNEHFLHVATRKLGYEIVGEAYPAPGGRMPDGQRMWLRLLVRDLSTWVPGAWGG